MTRFVRTMYIAGTLTSGLTAALHLTHGGYRSGLGWLALTGIWVVSGLLRSHYEGDRV
jgi:hypothetical protein